MKSLSFVPLEAPLFLPFGTELIPFLFHSQFCDIVGNANAQSVISGISALNCKIRRDLSGRFDIAHNYSYAQYFDELRDAERVNRL